MDREYAEWLFDQKCIEDDRIKDAEDWEPWIPRPVRPVPTPTEIACAAYVRAMDWIEGPFGLHAQWAAEDRRRGV